MFHLVQTYAPVALGGALGAVLRVLAARPFTGVYGTAAWPWWLIFVNVSGSFLIGIAWALLSGHRISQDWGPFFVTGLLGGYTTFSTFSLDAIRLLEDGRLGAAAGYVFASVGLSLAAAYGGLVVGRALP
ncbi:MAG: fluoride efflux transporter CrcB [Paracoccaceae bacterium]|nr:fluoride efflux transporter CrcB [Paracoccaceae bacterium]